MIHIKILATDGQRFMEEHVATHGLEALLGALTGAHLQERRKDNLGVLAEGLYALLDFYQMPPSDGDKPVAAPQNKKGKFVTGSSAVSGLSLFPSDAESIALFEARCQLFSLASFRKQLIHRAKELGIVSILFPLNLKPAAFREILNEELPAVTGTYTFGGGAVKVVVDSHLAAISHLMGMPVEKRLKVLTQLDAHEWVQEGTREYIIDFIADVLSRLSNEADHLEKEGASSTMVNLIRSRNRRLFVENFDCLYSYLHALSGGKTIDQRTFLLIAQEWVSVFFRLFDFDEPTAGYYFDELRWGIEVMQTLPLLPARPETPRHILAWKAFVFFLIKHKHPLLTPRLLNMTLEFVGAQLAECQRPGHGGSKIGNPSFNAMKETSEKLVKEETLSKGGVAEVEKPAALLVSQKVLAGFVLSLMKASLHHEPKGKGHALVTEWGTWRQWGKEQKGYEEFNALLEAGFQEFVLTVQQEIQRHKKKKDAKKYEDLLALLIPPKL